MHVRVRHLKAVIAVLALSGPMLSGCGILNRQDYSLIIRRPAHQYRRLSEVEKEELELFERTRITSSDGFRRAYTCEPFRPFTYCINHDSYHVPESIAAIILAPVEYPTVLGGDLTGVAVRETPGLVVGLASQVGAGAVWLWESVFPPPEPEPPRPEAPREEESPGEGSGPR